MTRDTHRSRVVSYRGRRVNPREPVEVYRNLHRKGVWYSVSQGGRVVGHTQFLLLHDVTCVVQEGGRRRAISTGVRNVHARLRGRILYAQHFAPAGPGPLKLRHRAGYAPATGFWVDYDGGYLDAFGDPDVLRMCMTRASVAMLSKDGLSVSEPEIDETQTDVLF